MLRPIPRSGSALLGFPGKDASRMEILENHVQGRWQRGTGALATLVNPTTGAPLAQAGTGGVDMRAALAHARDVGGPALRRLSFAQRGALLMAASKALHAQRDA